MRFLWSKQTAILDNLSNVETPGYKEKYVTFEEALRNRLQSASTTHSTANSFRDVLTKAKPITHEANSESARMDGNGVNVTEQSVELSRNAFQLQYVMNAVSTDLSTLRTAIRG
ncbi:MAG: flgB [Paenibacillus sp.]|nr:flgB [Paenibacillus sp.]